MRRLLVGQWMEKCSYGGTRYAARVTRIKSGRNRAIWYANILSSLPFLAGYTSRLSIQRRILDFPSRIQPREMITVLFGVIRHIASRNCLHFWFGFDYLLEIILNIQTQLLTELLKLLEIHVVFVDQIINKDYFYIERNKK